MTREDAIRLGDIAFNAAAKLVGALVTISDAIADENAARTVIGLAFVQIAASQLRGRMPRDEAIEVWREALDDDKADPDDVRAQTDHDLAAIPDITEEP